MSAENRDVVMGFIEAMGRCDADAAGSFLGPDATCALMRSPYDHVDDRDALLRTIAATPKMVPGGITPTVTNLIIDGDRIAAECQGHGVTADGKRYDNRYCWVFTLHDGKIAAINQYLCTELAAKTFPRPPA